MCVWGGHVSIKLYCQKWVTVIFGPWVIVCQPVLYTTARNKMKTWNIPKKKKKRERERERKKDEVNLTNLLKVPGYLCGRAVS